MGEELQVADALHKFAWTSVSLERISEKSSINRCFS